MIVFSCPNCDVEIEAPDDKAGAKATCAECGVRLEIPNGTNGAKKVSSVTAQKPSTKRRRDDMVDEETAEKPSPAPKRRRGEEEEETVETPRGALKRRRGEDEDEESEEAPAEKKSSPMTLWIGGGVAAAIGVVVLIIILMSSGKDTPPAKRVADKPPTPPVQPEDTSKKVELVASDKKIEDDDKDEPVAEQKATPTANDIWRHVVKSSTFIVNTMRGGQQMASGSGSLIDKKNRIVLTNFHVVYNRETLVVCFPIFDPTGKLVSEKDVYMSRLRTKSPDFINATVLRVDRAKDIALIQIERVPDGVEQLAVAKEGVSTGDDVYSVGNPGGGNAAMWLLSPGKVRQVFHFKRPVGMGQGEAPLQVDAQVIQTQSPTYHGDSGGPLVNTSGALVGITESGNDKVPGTSLFIELSEVREFIRSTYAKAKITWNEEDAKSLVVQSPGQVVDYTKRLKSKDPKKRAKAAQRLATFGNRARVAVPELIKMLKEEDAVCRSMAQDALAKIGAPDSKEISLLITSLKDKMRDVRAYAAQALGLMGHAAHSAGPELVAALKDSDATVRRNAALALGKVGFDDKTKAFEALKPLLEDSDQAVRVASAEALTTVTVLGASDLPLLQEFLKHRDVEVKIVAASTLGRMGQTAKPALKDLTQAVKENVDQNFRRAAIRTLARFGPDAMEAVPVLLEVMKDDNLRPDIILAFIRMGPAAKDAVKDLRIALSDENPETRSNSIAALGKIGPFAQEAVADLVHAMKNDPTLRIAVLDALLLIGNASEAVEDLIPFFKEKDEKGKYDKVLRQKTMDVLVKVGSQRNPAGVAAIEALKAAAATDRSEDVRLGATETLGAIGPPARRAAAILQRVMMVDPSKNVKIAAQKALFQVTRKQYKKP